MDEESFYVKHVDWIVVDGAHTVESVNKSTRTASMGFGQVGLILMLSLGFRI